MEPAARRRVRRARNGPFQLDVLPVHPWIGGRNGRQQCLRVRVLWVREHLLGRSDLGNLTEVHHCDPITHLTDDRHVVTDEQHRQPELRLNLVDQRENLGADGHVQCRHRLVGDDEVRVQHECTRQRDALFLSAGELVWVPVVVAPRQPDTLQQVFDDRPPTVSVGHPVDLQRLGDGASDLHPRIEAGRGVLKDHLCVASEPFQLCLVERGDVVRVGTPTVSRPVTTTTAVEDHLPGGRLFESDDRRGGRRLPTAGLSDEPERLSAPDVEGDPIDCLRGTDLSVQYPLRDRVVFLEIPDGDDRLVSHPQPPWSVPCSDRSRPTGRTLARSRCTTPRGRRRSRTPAAAPRSDTLRPRSHTEERTDSRRAR